jgi:hypothetical protein
MLFQEGSIMNHRFLSAYAGMALALSVPPANNAVADCNLPAPVSGDTVVWAWGQNDYGQLGDGTTIARLTPVRVLNLTGVARIAAGMFHSLALKNDGTVWAWGQNDSGQLGDGTTTGRLTPVQVLNLSGVTCIAAGALHNLALKSDGTVWAWGNNSFSELGDGTAIDRHKPVQVPNLRGVTAVAGGDAHSLALKNDDTVWAWGNNEQGQLGDGTTIARQTLGQVMNLGGITAIAAGPSYNLALGIGAPPFVGIVYAWGQNDFGQLGDGTNIARYTPVQAATLSGHKAIAAGGAHSLAVGATQPYLNVRDVVVHPDTHHLRLFNLRIDGVVVRANDNGGNTGFHPVSPGNHTVDETGGTGTPLGAFEVVMGGDCAANGTVTLALGDVKTCTITNYDHVGGCARTAICCEPGDGTQGCLVCSKPGKGCPGQ